MQQIQIKHKKTKRNVIHSSDEQSSKQNKQICTDKQDSVQSYYNNQRFVSDQEQSKNIHIETIQKKKYKKQKQNAFKIKSRFFDDIIFPEDSSSLIQTNTKHFEIKFQPAIAKKSLTKLQLKCQEFKSQRLINSIKKEQKNITNIDNQQYNQIKKLDIDIYQNNQKDKYNQRNQFEGNVNDYQISIQIGIPKITNCKTIDQMRYLKKDYIIKDELQIKKSVKKKFFNYWEYKEYLLNKNKKTIRLEDVNNCFRQSELSSSLKKKKRKQEYQLKQSPIKNQQKYNINFIQSVKEKQKEQILTSQYPTKVKRVQQTKEKKKKKRMKNILDKFFENEAQISDNESSQGQQQQEQLSQVSSLIDNQYIDQQSHQIRNLYLQQREQQYFQKLFEMVNGHYAQHKNKKNPNKLPNLRRQVQKINKIQNSQQTNFEQDKEQYSQACSQEQKVELTCSIIDRQRMKQVYFELKNKRIENYTLLNKKKQNMSLISLLNSKLLIKQSHVNKK